MKPPAASRQVMSLAEHLRRMMAPGRERWKPMLLGLAISAAAAGMAVLTQPGFVSLGFLVVAFVAWFAGACAMVGYARWFFAGELVRAAQDRAEALERERK
jgi:hypothetical protein